jgi:hypothetical protein
LGICEASSEKPEGLHQTGSTSLEELAGDRSRAGNLQKIAEVYPLPTMDILHLQYA